MNAWTVALLGSSLFGVSLATPVAGQGIYVPEGPGYLTVGDFDGDRVDDVLLLGMYGKSAFYKGSSTPPYHLSKIHDFGLVNYWSLTDGPIYLGGYLYVPMSISGGFAKVAVFAYRGTAWQQVVAVQIRSIQPGGFINSLRITELHKDIDKDGIHDVLAVWGDVPVGSSGGFHTAYISPSGGSKYTVLPKITGQTTYSTVVDVHRAQPMAPPAAPEYLVTMSARLTNRLGGFGFRMIADGPKAGPGVWASGAPPLAYNNFVIGESPVAYGEFNLMPAMKTPLVHLSTGESVLFAPWVTAPYINKFGEWFGSTVNSLFLNQCVADYDGDGIDEIVMLENHGGNVHTYMHLGDPSRSRHYSQFFYLRSKFAPYPTDAMHGATGDFNGDGTPDLLISGYMATPTGTRGFLSLYVTDRSQGPRKPALVRAY